MNDSVLLLTGATGLVGGGLLKLLCANPSRRCAVLVRAPERARDINASGGLRIFKGDITLPRLGLEDRQYAELRDTITEIVHCAADTRFGIPLEDARRVNTSGTAEVLALASQCRRLQKFAYISTAYVVGRAEGHFSEGPIRHQQGFCNSYQQSKYEAEELVSQAMGEIPISVFRLSSIIGDSVTGEVRQLNYFHRLMKLFPQNLLPVIPGRPDAPIDLIAGDWAIPALAFLFESAFVPGRYYHLCAGPTRSLTVREILDLMLSAYESHPAGQKWLPIRVPELVSLSRYEEFVERERQTGDRLFNQVTTALAYSLPHLALFQTFDNTNTLNALSPSGLEMPSMRTCCGRVIRFCLDTNWGSRPRQASHVKAEDAEGQRGLTHDQHTAEFVRVSGRRPA
jgi:nucleoside-diphosphate-sugar epimerase